VELLTGRPFLLIKVIGPIVFLTGLRFGEFLFVNRGGFPLVINGLGGKNRQWGEEPRIFNSEGEAQDGGTQISPGCGPTQEALRAGGEERVHPIFPHRGRV